MLISRGPSVSVGCLSLQRLCYFPRCLLGCPTGCIVWKCCPESAPQPGFQRMECSCVCRFCTSGVVEVLSQNVLSTAFLPADRDEVVPFALASPACGTWWVLSEPLE